MAALLRDFVDVYPREIINNTNIHYDLEYLVRHQEVQEKCFREISRETGEASPSLRHNLPFCGASDHPTQTD